MIATWAEARASLARTLGGREEADEWLMQALEATYGEPDESRLAPRAASRALVCAGAAALALERHDADLALSVGARRVVADALRLAFRCGPLDGPPWRLDPGESDRPTREAWLARADLGSAGHTLRQAG